MPRRLNRCSLLLATLALLLGALAPTVSQGLAFLQRDAVALELCTRGGLVPAGEAGGGGEAPSLLHGFCAYCLPHAGSFGLPPAPHGPPPPPFAAAHTVALAAVVAPRAVLWSSSLARAPPAVA